MLKKIKEIYNYRQMLESMVLTDLRTRYKGSFLGFFWTLLNPLLMLAVYSMIFKYVVRISLENYTSYLFIGIISWNLLSQSLTSGATAVVRNAGLVKKIYFPKEILPLSVVIGGIINFLLSLIVLFPVLLFSHIEMGWPLLFLPILLVVFSIFTLALTTLVSCLNVYFRDLEHIIGVFIMAWFYLTPIVFTSDMIPAGLKTVFNLNPMTTIMEGFHDVFFYNKVPDLSILSVIAVLSIGLLIICYATFAKLSRNFAEEI
ncbi:ABC transporter permease [Paenibacillus sp. 19GGS1-52]|uniref:ABC transporter permease n=1 Tax=Paenibacillus sp. 19GGS1-52 TaxID=2758563 RepID=UPI001EFB375A|nr:ABC transporter permease [Paenibacillus sp. 19GGS1-52]ULO08035.1 ABC transporter permease [Paenibacillus sp. 19GGS1-52]